MMIEKRTGELCPKAIIQNALNELLGSRQSIIGFVQQLLTQRIKAIPNIASTGKMNGFSFEYSGISFKASQLGKAYSWPALQGKLDYQPERDNGFLFALKMPSVSKASVSEAPCMFMTTDAPEITTTEANGPIAALIHDNRAGQDEYANALAKQLHLEPSAGAQEEFATEAVKEASKRSYRASTFRWLETIPYLNTIITIFKNLKIPTLKRPRKHKTITGVRVLEITPSTSTTTLEISSIHRGSSPTM